MTPASAATDRGRGQIMKGSDVNQRTCAQCGSPSSTKFCSERCKWAARPRIPCAECGESTGYPIGRGPESPVCRPCRHDGAVSCGSPSGYRRGCRCSACTEAHRAKIRTYSAARTAEGRPLNRSRRKVERVCVGCGVAFSVRADSATRYCAIRCHNLSTRGIDPSAPPRPKRRRKSEVRKRAERRAAKAARGTSGGNLVWIQGRCLVCEEHFPPSPGLASRYCSPDCRAVSRRRSSWVGYAARLAVYERDEWTCQICNESVDRSADHLDDWAPTLDHIVPRSLGGSDDVENLRLAHRWCNSARGNLTHYSDADLAS